MGEGLLYVNKHLSYILSMFRPVPISQSIKLHVLNSFTYWYLYRLNLGFFFFCQHQNIQISTQHNSISYWHVLHLLTQCISAIVWNRYIITVWVFPDHLLKHHCTNVCDSRLHSQSNTDRWQSLLAVLLEINGSQLTNLKWLSRSFEKLIHSFAITYGVQVTVSEFHTEN